MSEIGQEPETWNTCILLCVMLFRDYNGLKMQVFKDTFCMSETFSFENKI